MYWFFLDRNLFSFEVISGKETTFKRFFSTYLFVGETSTNKYGGTQERKKNTLVYSASQSIIRGARQVTVHSSKAVALLCRAIKMD